MKCCDTTKECEKRGPDGKCETRRSGWMECAERELARLRAKIAELEAPQSSVGSEPPAVILPPADEDAGEDSSSE